MLTLDLIDGRTKYVFVEDVESVTEILPGTGHTDEHRSTVKMRGGELSFCCTQAISIVTDIRRVKG